MQNYEIASIFRIMILRLLRRMMSSRFKFDRILVGLTLVEEVRAGVWYRCYSSAGWDTVLELGRKRLMIFLSFFLLLIQ